MLNTLRRRSPAGFLPILPIRPAGRLERVLRMALLPATAWMLAACSSSTTVSTPVLAPPVADASAAVPAEVPMLGLASLSFGSPISGTGSPVRVGNVVLTPTSSQVTQDASQMTFWTTYTVDNAGSTPLQNLTLLAVHGTAGIAGTSVTTMSASDGSGLTDPAAARGLLPSSQIPALLGAADAQVYTPAESQDFTTDAQTAGVLTPDDEVLGYGFAVRGENGEQTLMPGGRGKVTLAYTVPDAAADVLPSKFASSFLLVQDEQAASSGTVVNAQQTRSLRTFAAPRGPLYGVIQSQSVRRSSDYQAGLRVRTLELAWDRAEPASGTWNTTYLTSKLAEYQADVRAGFEVVLDLGVQYPPSWLFQLPDSRFVDQHGTAYISDNPGTNPVNAVFNNAVRDRQARYVKQVFQRLGTSFYAVRLGWGHYGELGYPLVNAAANSYWAFDALAQGQRPGLPAGIQTDPVPGWTPPTGHQSVSATDRQNARRFADWYLNSLKNYHDWQISLVRGAYPGRLFMLYPSFGLRPGQLDQAVAGGLSGQTSPEINTELQRGFDFARYIAGIRDPLVSPYTTWLDVDGFFVDDSGSNSAGWSPAHYFSVLATANALQLKVWGENTGRNSRADLSRCMSRVKTYQMGGMFWAFNEDLYDTVHASISDYHAMIAAQ